MNTQSNRKQLAREAKAIVALAFRNGPIEDLHAGKPCPVCEGKAGFIRITDEEMKAVMKNAVDHVYRLLLGIPAKPNAKSGMIPNGIPG